MQFTKKNFTVRKNICTVQEIFATLEFIFDILELTVRKVINKQ